jgi:hypothetical protein
MHIIVGTEPLKPGCIGPSVLPRIDKGSYNSWMISGALLTHESSQICLNFTQSLKKIF